MKSNLRLVSGFLFLVVLLSLSADAYDVPAGRGDTRPESGRSISVSHGSPAVSSPDGSSREAPVERRRQTESGVSPTGAGAESTGDLGPRVRPRLILCFVLLLFVVALERILSAFINRRMERIPPEHRAVTWEYGILRSLSKPLTVLILVYGISWTLSGLFGHLRWSEDARPLHFLLDKAADIGATIAVVWLLFRVGLVVDEHFEHAVSTTDSKIDAMLLPLAGITLRALIIIVGAVVFIQTFTGFDISALLIHMGLVGLALALAAKETLANLFGAFTILFDKPFQIGDQIAVNEHEGIVESIGFRSTKIRTFRGHLVVVPNHTLITSYVRNVSQGPHMHWETSIGVACDTPPEKMKRAVEILTEILTAHTHTAREPQPQVFFNNFNDWSLNIAVFACCSQTSWPQWHAWREDICLSILERFEAEGIRMPFPSQTVYLGNEDQRELQLRMIKGDEPQAA